MLLYLIFFIFLWNYVFHCVLVANTLYWDKRGCMVPWKSAQFKPVFASFILPFNPSQNSKKLLIHSLGSLASPCTGSWLHFSENTWTQLPIESLNATSKLAGGNKKTQEVLLLWEHDWWPSMAVMLWSKISSGRPNGKSRIRHFSWREEKAQSHLSFASFSKEWFISIVYQPLYELE